MTSAYLMQLESKFDPQLCSKIGRWQCVGQPFSLSRMASSLIILSIKYGCYLIYLMCGGVENKFEQAQIQLPVLSLEELTSCNSALGDLTLQP